MDGNLARGAVGGEMVYSERVTGILMIGAFGLLTGGSVALAVMVPGDFWPFAGAGVIALALVACLHSFDLGRYEERGRKRARG